MPETDEDDPTAHLTEHPIFAGGTGAEAGGEPTVRLIGYLGRDPQAGYWRLYYTSRLETYVRVPEADIVSNTPHTRDSGPMARSVVVAKNPSSLMQISPLPHEVQAGFLGGSVAASMTAGSPSRGVPPVESTLATGLACIATVTLVLVTLEATSSPPVPTDPGPSLASCCLCWTPEASC